MRYFFTYNRYFDCPTCDPFDPEASISSQYDSLFELILDLKNHIDYCLFLNLHSIDEDGTIKSVATINYSTGFHSITEVSITTNEYTYIWSTNNRTTAFTLTSNDPNFNLIYGK